MSRTAFNKENGPELLGQLLRVLKSNGMDESLDAVKRCGLTKKLNDEWMDDTRNRQKRKRDKRAGQSKEEKQDMVLKVLHDGGTIGSIEADLRKYFDSRMGSREIEKILLDLKRQGLVDQEVQGPRGAPAFEIWFLTSKGERSIRASLRIAAVDEKLMDRAAQVLQYHNERDAMKHLISEGVSRQDAYFAVKAGKILNEDRMKRRVALRHLAAGANK